ncbi:MAG TPA: LuxR C-terminal-related transcriptional regulator [Pseudonocardiaceae bacterium]|nr:LuxR C-terminal-related transcriptional regulator [Pseudonocardiaceae bacterium]
MDERRVAGGSGCNAADDSCTSKIGVPTLPEWVIPRPRLTTRLGKGTRRALTVVTGVPGAGKTVAVASWVAARAPAASKPGGPEPGTLAWVTGDDGDSDPEVFWCYLQAALRRAGVDLPVTGSSPFRDEGIDHLGIAELASVLIQRERPVVLVLDDFRPAAGSVLVAGVAYLLKLARPWLRLVVISRRDVPLPLHRYRLTGELTEIRSDDLAFSERETDELMTQHGVVLRRDSVRALRARTEGWAAGLRLAAMSMSGHPDPDGFVAHFTSGEDAVAGYLVEEVLDAQRPTVRRMLLATSVLDRVDAEIAAELTPGADGSEFAEVVGQNAFIRPLGNGWYRYHQMFRDVLRLRFQHENPGQLAVLHCRAAGWFSARGQLTEAVQHAAAAQDWRLASALVVDRLAIGDLLGLRPARLLGAALRGLPVPGESAELEPVLVSAALALAAGDEQTSRSALRHSAELLGQVPPDEAATARACAAVLRLVHARLYHEAGVGEAATEAERLLGRVRPDLVEDRPEVRALVLLGRAGTQLWSGQWAHAAESFAAAHTCAVQADSVLLRLDCLAHGALVEALRGRWGRAGELATHAVQLAPPQASPLRRGMVALPLVRAWIALQGYRLTEARRVLDPVDPALLVPAQSPMAVLRELVGALIDIAEGHHHRALETLNRVCTMTSVPSWLVRRVMLAKVEAHIVMGAPIAAWQAAIRAGGTHTCDGVVALARAQLCAGHAEAAADTLRPALGEAMALRSEVRVEALLVDAQSSYATGDSLRGRRSLDRALRLGDRDQLRLPFAACTPWLRSALRSAQQLARQYLRLLEPLRIGLGESAERSRPGPLVSRQLSDRELEVLRHLAQMRTSEEIATEMYVSINTVKTHLKSIYRKLAVTRRGDAVRRAHQLELLVRTSSGLPGGESPADAQRSQQPELAGPPDGFGARRRPQLAVDQAGVALDCVHRDE